MTDDEISLQFATYAEKKLDWPRRDSIVRRSVNAFVAIGYALLGIHVELRRLNEGRDSFHREVLEVLTQAKEPARCGETFQHPQLGTSTCSLQPGHYGEHVRSAEGVTFQWATEGPSGAGATAQVVEKEGP